MASPSPSVEEDLQVTPRLCHLVKWPDFEGYGFNLHAEKSRPGQFVGAVDPGSPAELAGLRPGDRIVEVNGVNVSHENHRQVVERIKAVERETRLLVLDPEADRKCREKKVVVKSTMPGVVVIKTPVPRSQDPPNYLNVEPTQQNGKTNGEEAPAANGKHEITSPEEKSSPVSAPKVVDTPPPPTKTKEEIVTSRSSTPSIPDSPRSTKSSSSGGVGSNGVPAHSVTPTQGGGLNLNMSASEMRQMLANRRKKDPKKEHMDIRQKYDIIQQM